MPVQVIAGNRRLGAVPKQASYPVEFNSTDELDVLEALVHANEQRTKTNEQLDRETQALLYVESERAKRRIQQALVTGNATRHGQSPAVPDSAQPATDPGNAIDKVADQLGVGRHKAEQARRVVQVIDQLTKGGKPQEAERVRRCTARPRRVRSYMHLSRISSLSTAKIHATVLKGEGWASPTWWSSSCARTTPLQGEAG